ncbi:hypothetical protein Ga0100231_003620 [Opitutaceae bacterium TAV4]|nr:hypothetical protein Ga0100231_003620 [Opitutaceae bacterium TAV4]RRK02021.1 hypothetical protein Ga0100230_002050 [Opitutaceae bacterium TAV3]
MFATSSSGVSSMPLRMHWNSPQESSQSNGWEIGVISDLERLDSGGAFEVTEAVSSGSALAEPLTGQEKLKKALKLAESVKAQLKVARELTLIVAEHTALP